ncbi:MAG: cation:proton antiporter domain-containing protein [Methanobacteriota archaeon]
MAELTFLKDLAVVMVVSAVTTLAFRKLRQPLILGYIIAGLIVGPFTFPVRLVEDVSSLRTLAELGVVFLLFSVGLDFNLRRLREVGAGILVAGVLEVLLMIGLGFQAGRALGWGTADALFLGAVLSIASTMIFAKLLLDLELSGEPFARLVFGILIVEDIVAVVLLAILGGFATQGLEIGGLLELSVKLGLFLSVSVTLGLVVIPALTNLVLRENDEILVVTVLGVLFAMAIFAAVLGFSVALGAFITGALVSEAQNVGRIRARIAPLRDVFTAVFFVSIGMLVNPALFPALWAPIAVAVAVLVLGKPLAVAASAFLAGFPPRDALRAGIGMAQIGEFSFIIAGQGLILGATSGNLFALTIAVAAVALAVNPFLLRRSAGMADAVARAAPAPFVTFVRTYHSAMAPSLASRADARRHGLVIRCFLYAGIIIALAVAANAFSGRAAVSGLGGADPALVEAGTWVAFGLLSLPFLVGFARAAGAVVAPALDVPGPLAEGDSVRRVVRHGIYLFVAILAASVLHIVGAPFVPSRTLLVPLLIGVGLAALLLWESTVRLHNRIEERLADLFGEKAAEDPETHDALLHLVQGVDLWGLGSQALVLGESTEAAGHTLEELNLPGRTGAIVASLERGDLFVANPGPATALASGDRIVLLGDPRQVRKAARLLARGAVEEGAAPRPALEFAEVKIPPGSKVAGSRIDATRIRAEAGVTIAAVRRGVDQFLSPPPSFVLHEHDEILLVGAKDQIEKAARWFDPRFKEGDPLGHP